MLPYTFLGSARSFCRAIVHKGKSARGSSSRTMMLGECKVLPYAVRHTFMICAKILTGAMLTQRKAIGRFAR